MLLFRWRDFTGVEVRVTSKSSISWHASSNSPDLGWPALGNSLFLSSLCVGKSSRPPALAARFNGEGEFRQKVLDGEENASSLVTERHMGLPVMESLSFTESSLAKLSLNMSSPSSKYSFPSSSTLYLIHFFFLLKLYNKQLTQG